MDEPTEVLPARNNEQELAKQRTDWAFQRTVLAYERTFSAWVRTGLTAVAAGLGIGELLRSAGWPWTARAIGAIFILVGGATYVVALWRYWQEYHELRGEGVRATPIALLALLVVALLVSTVLALFLVAWP